MAAAADTNGVRALLPGNTRTLLQAPPLANNDHMMIDEIGAPSMNGKPKMMSEFYQPAAMPSIGGPMMMMDNNISGIDEWLFGGDNDEDMMTISGSTLLPPDLADHLGKASKMGGVVAGRGGGAGGVANGSIGGDQQQQLVDDEGPASKKVKTEYEDESMMEVVNLTRSRVYAGGGNGGRILKTEEL